MSGEELGRLLARAADAVNANPRERKNFRQARSLPDREANGPYVGYGLERVAAMLRFELSEDGQYDVGWWYGRLTDPRRPWHRELPPLKSP